MALFVGERQGAAQAVAALCFENPYSPARAELERRALGPDYREVDFASGDPQPNAAGLAGLAERLVHDGQIRLAEASVRDPQDVAVYEGLVCHHLLRRLEELLEALSQACAGGGLSRRRVSSYRLFEEEAGRLLTLPGAPLPLARDLPQLFSLLFQLRRARALIDVGVVGRARVANEVRSSLWSSLFTHDVRRYAQHLTGWMDRVSTLLVGPAGTPKARLARVLALSRNVVFDPEQLRFVQEPTEVFCAVDLAATSPAEVRLLAEDRPGDPARQAQTGWLAATAERGCLFLDEVDQLPSTGQGILAGVLQSRQLSHPGGPESRPFDGKLVAGTRQDLVHEMRAGRLREDLYYQLGADVIELPALGLQLRQRPEDLRLFAADWLSASLPQADHDAVISTVEALVERELGPRYPWPGNLAELEQCMRSVLVRGSYHPVPPPPEARSRVVGSLSRRFADGEFNADGLLDAYCTLMYRQTGSYQEAARRLGLDRRTVKSRVDATLLAELS